MEKEIGASIEGMKSEQGWARSPLSNSALDDSNNSHDEINERSVLSFASPSVVWGIRDS